jgi:hypothetical protein
MPIRGTRGKKASPKRVPKAATKKAGKPSAKATSRKPAPRKAVPRKPAPAAALDAVFEGLKKLLTPYARQMIVKHDGPGIYYLETAPVPKYGTEVFFGAVKTGNRSVSFHLMPLYVFPELITGASAALRRRMLDESSFQFSEVDAPLFRELAELTRQGFDGYRRGGLFEPE